MNSWLSNEEDAGREFQPLEPNKLPEQLAQQHAGRRPRLALQARGSKFQRFQEVRIQELSCEVSSFAGNAFCASAQSSCMQASTD